MDAGACVSVTTGIELIEERVEEDIETDFEDCLSALLDGGRSVKVAIGVCSPPH